MNAKNHQLVQNAIEAGSAPTQKAHNRTVVRWLSANPLQPLSTYAATIPLRDSRY